MEITKLAYTVDGKEIDDIIKHIKDGKIDYAVEILSRIGNTEEVNSLSGKTAGICYMKENYTEEAIQNTESAIKRAKATGKKGHHSIFDHSSITLLITGIPKILAMMLNNTQYYTTSEKSARYTEMKPKTEIERRIYSKWKEKFTELISREYPKLDSKAIEKLAMENARYSISVLTETTMAYTTSYRQIAYLIDWIDKLECTFDSQGLYGRLYIEIIKSAIELKYKLIELLGEQVINDNKNREFTLFSSKDTTNEIIGDSYKLKYRASFAELAQEQRHRTLTFTSHLDESNIEFYVPRIIRGTELEQEWLKDLHNIKDCYPQGTLLDIVERGTFENFILKSKERLCGRAQLEICDITKYNMEKFILNKGKLNKNNLQLLSKNTSNNRVVTKCKMDGFKCNEVCVWGSRKGLDRII